MEPNDPGREPEPTDADAELLARTAQLNSITAQANQQLSNGGWLCDWSIPINELSAMIDTLLSGARPMPDTPAPVCYAPTRVFGKFRTCELPSGHEGRHESHLGGETVWWENNGPECEHGHLARVCVHCELIAAEARVAELERENAALWAELNNARRLAGEGGA